MRTKIPVSGLKAVQNKAVDDYFWQHYFNNTMNLCSLCGNRGIIDTRNNASGAGRLNYCICPNGRAMRELPKKYPLQAKTNIIVNGMKFEVLQPTIYYEDLVQLIYHNTSTEYTITYNGSNGHGTLTPNQGVEVVPDIYFTVITTSNA